MATTKRRPTATDPFDPPGENFFEHPGVGGISPLRDKLIFLESALCSGELSLA